MRGENILFKEKENILFAASKQRKGFGRNKELIAARNKAICARYYFYITFLPFKYELVIKLIASDFYLAAYTVIDIVTVNIDEVATMKKQKPSLKELCKDYLHFNWDVNEAMKKAALLN